MFVKYMLGVLKNLQIPRTKKNLNELNLIFFYLSEYVMNRSDVENFTIYLKTIVKFGLLDFPLFVFIRIIFSKFFFFYYRRNIRDDQNFSCRYDKDNDPYCPIFRIGEIFQALNTNISALLHEVNMI